MHILHCILRKFMSVLYKIDFVNDHLYQADRDCEAFGVTLCFDIFPYMSLFFHLSCELFAPVLLIPKIYKTIVNIQNNKRFKF